MHQLLNIRDVSLVPHSPLHRQLLEQVVCCKQFSILAHNRVNVLRAYDFHEDSVMKRDKARALQPLSSHDVE